MSNRTEGSQTQLALGTALASFPTMSVSLILASQLEQLTPPEKAAVAEALWRQVDEQWQPTEAQLTELQCREDAAQSSSDGTLPVGEEVRRLRR
jgi:hypothetical protein